MRENDSTIVFNYNCGICDRYGGPENKTFKTHPVIYKPTQEKIMICETCFAFVQEAGEYSTYEIIKKGKK
jgi:hypothetical protein